MNNLAPIKLVSGIIVKHNKVLLGLRKNTQDFNHYWSLPIGHVEKQETYLTAIKRELKEELSIDVLSVSEFCLKTDPEKNIHHQVFNIQSWDGVINNSEPDLCEQLSWFEFNQLPQRLTPVSRDILKDFISISAKLSRRLNV